MTDLPRTIGRYQVRAVIGRGMMGVVYDAFDPDLGRPVALKSVQLTFAASPDQQLEYDLRFVSEARAAAGIAHPAVVVVHDVGRDPGSGRPFIAFERLAGRPLDEVVARDGPLVWTQAVAIAAAVARGLHAAHRLGIVHRDVKPANIMLLPDGQPKVMDFGIAKLPASELTSTGQFMGTPAFVSPEQLAGAAVDGRSDVFSLGGVLYFLLTGRVAFDGGSIPATLQRVTFEDPAPPSTLVAALPSDLDGVVACALAKNPADRHPHAQAFAEDLDDVAAGRPPRHLARRRVENHGTLVSARTEPDELVLEPLDPEPPRAGVGLPRVPHAPGTPRRTGLVAGVAAALVALLVALALFGRGGAPGSSLSLAAPPGQLEIDFTHSLRGGTLRVFVDDRLALEEPLESYVAEDLVVLKLRKGRERVRLDVAPGERQVRVEVESAGFNGTRRLSGDFASGASRRLVLRVGGLLSKELRASWAD
ncbi:MAG: serine/threonine-protein kinase [Vicinamibacteria bacterium]